MIHIATVHHLSDKWIDIQLKYIDKYIKAPHRVYAFLNGIKKDHSHKFYYSAEHKIKGHAKLLNILAKKIIETAEDHDLIMFLDGDAFPVQEIDNFMEENLKIYKLLAIKRLIDFGDCQPHPAFCVTTVGLWKSLDANWLRGFSWYNVIYKKQVADVGGNLLKILIDNNISWYPLIRSNIVNPHPRWFGVYDNIIYHHGAGFRIPISNVDSHKITGSFSKIEVFIDKIRFVRVILYSKTIIKTKLLGRSIFNKILTDFDFYKKL